MTEPELPASPEPIQLPGLRRDTALLAHWPGPAPIGLAAAVIGARGAVLAVTAEPVGPGKLDAAVRRWADLLGVGSVDLVVASGGTLLEVLRDWLFQAAQGSGRGVHIQLETGSAGQLRLLLQSWDSSAREVLLRLSSPQDPALAALTALLPHPAVELVDVS